MRSSPVALLIVLLCACAAWPQTPEPLAHWAMEEIVDGVVAVAHVEAGDVDAGFDEGVDLLGARAGGADGADDLRSTGHVHNRT